MLTIKEFFYLLALNIQVKWFNFIEFIYVIVRYYSNFVFAKVDLILIAAYFFKNPFRLSKSFLLSRGEKEIYTYGETPLTTLELIAKKCHLSSKDVVYELGCGRGRTCFWLQQFVCCSVVGIDYVPAFIDKAHRIQNYFSLEGLNFKLENFFKASLKEATVIYFYGTCQSSSSIQKLIEHFSTLPKGTKVITVSYCLSDFDKSSSFKVIKQFSAPFTWGKGEVYLQVKC